MSKRDREARAMRIELARIGVSSERHVIRPRKLIIPVLAWSDKGGSDVRLIWHKTGVVLTFRNTLHFYDWKVFPGVARVLEACDVLRACEALDLMPVE